MDNLDDKELLKKAEDSYLASTPRRYSDEFGLTHAVQQSIAASLLVIARNSLPVTEYKIVDRPPIIPNRGQMIGTQQTQLYTDQATVMQQRKEADRTQQDKQGGAI